ncbi:MAG: hypothetical protein ACFE96_11160 [Candidatus Hermodarchaeota archaeon]
MELNIELSHDAGSLLIEQSEIWIGSSEFATGHIQGFEGRSALVSPMFGLTDGDFYAKASVRYLIRTVENSGYLYEKGPLDLQFFHGISSKLNEYIQEKTFTSLNDFKKEIMQLLDQKRDEINIIAQNVYGKDEKSKYIKWIDKWEQEIDGLIILFRNQINNIAIQLPNNQFKLVWEDHITHSFLRFIGEQGIIPSSLSGRMLKEDPNFFGIIEFSDSTSNPVAIINPSKIDSGMVFNIPMLVVHNIKTGQWGLIRSDQLKYFKRWKSDYEIGFKDPTTEKVFADVILNTKEGYVLDNRIALELVNGKYIMHDRGVNWYRQYLSDSRYFSGQNGAFILQNCYRNIMYITGKNVVPFLQEITYEFSKTEAYEPYFKQEGVQKSKLATEILKNDVKEKAIFDLVEEIYHNDFTNEKLYKTFNFLFEPTEGMYDQLPQPFVMKYLIYLNGRYVDNYKGFIYGPSSEEINYYIKELDFKNTGSGNNYIGELDKLMWKLKGGKGYNGLQTKKQWLSLIYDKITSYNGEDKSLLFEKSILLSFKEKFDYEELFSTNSRFRKFNIKESRLAIKIYESAMRLFGHFTVRLMHVGMVEYCVDRSIKVVNRPSLDNFGEILFRIGFIPPTLSDRDIPVDSFIRREGHRYITAHIFGDFFLRASFKLPLIDFASSTPNDYMVYFPTGPVPYVTDSFESSNLRILNWKLSKVFQESYISDFEVYTRGLTYDRIQLAREFLDSQTNLFNKIVDLVTRKITPCYVRNKFPRISNEEATGRASILINEIIKALRRQLFIGELSHSTIRKDIEVFLQSGELFTVLSFPGIIDPTTNEEFHLRIFRNDFDGVDFKIWGWQRLWGSDFIDLLIQSNIRDTVPFLEDLILKYGNKKVKIYPLFLDKGSYSSPTDSIDYLPPSGCFEIDLTTEETRRQSLFILTHISFIMLAHETIFLVKDYQGSLNDGDLIFAFNNNGFIKKEQILFSSAMNIAINNYISEFYDEIVGYNKMWKELWRFSISIGTAHNSQFGKYLKSIVSGESDHFSQEYMDCIRELLDL